MKLTLTFIVICLAYAISCLASPVNGRPHPIHVHELTSRSESDTDSDTESSSDSEFDPCSTSPCKNDGTCVVAGIDFTCDCQVGYFGKTCEDFDPCSTNPCKNGGTCLDTGSEFNCSCPDRYFGNTCEELEACPSEWILYNGSCYFFSQERKTWVAARDACTLLGGYLIVVSDQPEQDFMNSQTDAESSFWLGANDIKDEGVLVWDYTGENVTFTYWNYYFANKDYKDCVKFYDYPISSYSNGWNVIRCSDKHNYICETDPLYN